MGLIGIEAAEKQANLGIEKFFKKYSYLGKFYYQPPCCAAPVVNIKKVNECYDSYFAELFHIAEEEKVNLWQIVGHRSKKEGIQKLMFLVAHGLGHKMLHSNFVVNMRCDSPQNITSSERLLPGEEQEANFFATLLLLPPAMLHYLMRGRSYFDYWVPNIDWIGKATGLGRNVIIYRLVQEREKRKDNLLDIIQLPPGVKIDHVSRDPNSQNTA